MVRGTALALAGVLLQPALPRGRPPDAIEQVATLHRPRAAHTATALPSGQVLVVGGMADGGGSLASVELLDPAGNTILELGPTAERRAGHTATRLRDGRVLIAGGYNGEYLASVEIFEPETRRFQRTGSLLEGRSGHSATLLPDGRVLFVAGVGQGWTFLRSAELYDPETGRSEAVGPISSPRESHTATLLADGRVLVIGGADRSDRVHYASTEIYDPLTSTFEPGPSMANRRYKIAGTSVRLPGGDVLVSSGTRVAELLEVASGTFREVPGRFPEAYRFAAAAPVGNGDVVITGGYSDANRNTSGVWRFRRP